MIAYCIFTVPILGIRAVASDADRSLDAKVTPGLEVNFILGGVGMVGSLLLHEGSLRILFALMVTTIIWMHVMGHRLGGPD